MSTHTELVEHVREAITEELEGVMLRDCDFDGLDWEEHYRLARAAVTAVAVFIISGGKK